ncbi:BRO family protein [Vibrio sp. S234-5]|uniref:BRO-N domain-containing protein n=1 Tax=Vibrio sp. S234-5 TaxID=1616781 RepID=UPI00069684B9|nr:BRO family protein [Vibrio sp. S234-5]
MTSALTFQNTRFDVVEKQNKIWLAAADIATALGYANSNSISRIYRRNSDEFTRGMTEEVKLALSGNYQKTARIFSLRGAHLIAMFARTEKAKEFRKWVLDILDKEAESGQTQPLTPTLPEPQLPIPSMTRIMLVIENGQTVEAKHIPSDAFVVSKSRIANLIAEPGIFTMQEMAQISEAVNKQIVEIAVSASRSISTH